MLLPNAPGRGWEGPEGTGAGGCAGLPVAGSLPRACPGAMAAAVEPARQDAPRAAEARSSRRAALGRLTLLAAAGLAGSGCRRGSGSPTPAASNAALLVFSRDGNLFIVTAQGRVRRQLTQVAEGGLARDPVWSPDGAQIAYAYTPPPATVRDTDGQFPQPVTDLYVMHADGTSVQVLVSNDGPGTGYETPVWAPDGRSLYVTYTTRIVEQGILRDEMVEVAWVPLDGGARRTIVSNAMAPTLSPDGKRLAFLALEGAARALVVANADGTQARTLVPAGRLGPIDLPRFSPDGRQIVFAGLPVADAAGTQASGTGGEPRRPGAGEAPPRAPVEGKATARFAARLGALAAALLGPVWPRAAYAHGLPMDLFLVDADGGNLRQLTHLGADSPAAAWAPDGQQLAMLCGGGIYLLRADGRHVRLINPQGGH